MKPGRFLSAAADMFINPVFIKEVRQAVRSRFLLAPMIIFLIILVCVTAGMFLSGEISYVVTGTTSSSAGRELFEMISMILNAACFVFIPLYVGIRLAAEKSDTNTDLMFITSIGPGQLIWGKMLSGMIMTLMFFFLALPFMIYSYVLNGVDIPTILTVALLLMMINVLVIYLAVLVAAIPASKPFKILLGLGAAVLLFIFVSSTHADASFFIDIVTSSRVGSFWKVLAYSAAYLSLICYCLHVIARAMLSPAMSNYMLNVRITMTVVVLSAYATARYYSIKESEPAIGFAFVIPSLILVTFLLLTGSSERETMSARVAGSVPKNPLLRYLAFPFFTGAANALAWGAIMYAVIWGLAFTFTDTGIARTGYSYTRKALMAHEETLPIVILCLYALAYVVTGNLIRIRLLSKWFNHRLTVIVVMITGAIFSLVPFITGICLKKIDFDTGKIGIWQLGNPIMAFQDKTLIPEHIIFASALILVSALISLKWYSAQLIAYNSAAPLKPQNRPADSR